MSELYGMHSYKTVSVLGAKFNAAWGYRAGHRGAHEQIKEWCERSFGQSAPAGMCDREWFASEYRYRGSINWGEVAFLKESDLNWFLLRWG